MPIQIPPAPIQPQTPIVPVAGTHTSGLNQHQLAQSVNNHLTQTSAYLKNSGTFNDMTADRAYGTAYQNTQPSNLRVKVFGTMSQNAFTSTDPTNQTPAATGTKVDVGTSVDFTVQPNCWYEVDSAGVLDGYIEYQVA